MKCIPINNLYFYNPDIVLDLNVSEEAFIKMTNLQKNDLGHYELLTSFNDDNIPVLLIVQFKEFEIIIEIIVQESKTQHGVLISKNELSNKTFDSLNKFTKENFGNPTFISNIFSKLNYPFYIKKWKYKKINVMHSYQDSVGALYESLKFVLHK